MVFLSTFTEIGASARVSLTIRLMVGSTLTCHLDFPNILYCLRYMRALFEIFASDHIWASITGILSLKPVVENAGRNRVLVKGCNDVTGFKVNLPPIPRHKLEKLPFYLKGLLRAKSVLSVCSPIPQLATQTDKAEWVS